MPRLVQSLAFGKEILIRDSLLAAEPLVAH